MIRFCFLAGWIVLVTGSVRVARGQDAAAAETRLEAMSRRAGTLKLVFDENAERTPPELSKAPVLRCNDPTREEVDGALWLWLDGPRPVAGLCVLFYAKGKWNYELTSLTDEALQLTGRPDWLWHPAAKERQWIALEGAVPEAPRARQLNMRTTARRFESSEVRRGERFPLRLVDRPIYTYADPEQDVIDAAVFAISYGTNPEILLQMEARKADGKTQWHAAFSRLSAAEVTVRLEEKDVWKVEPIDGPVYDAREPYFAINEAGSLE